MADETEMKRVSIEKVSDTVKSTNTCDTIINIIKAILASVPWGGGIASLLSDYLPTARFRRLEKFAIEVANDLNRLSDKVDHEYIKTSEFGIIFESCFQKVANNPKQQKIDSFRGILLNSTINRNIGEDEKEYFINLADSLTVLHILILKFMHDPINYLKSMNISENKIRGGFSQFFPIAIPEMPLDVIESAFGDLYRLGLLSTDQTIFSTMTSAQGLRLLGDRITDLGKRFIEYCKIPD